jgi:hypothetical protein
VASPPEDDDLTRAADAAFDGLDRESPLDGLPRPRQVFVLVYSAQGVLDNGGFTYFLGCDWPATPPYARFVEAYREIGAGDLAAAIERATALFSFPEPHRDRDARRRVLESESAKPTLDELDSVAVGATERVHALLKQFARRHAAEFRLT